MDILPIETPRLLLRQFAVEDAEDVFAIFSDEQTTLDCGGYHAFGVMDEEYGFAVPIMGTANGVGINLFSRAASSQVSSAPMSLTSVFGMGTGGSSSQSTPTMVTRAGIEPALPA